MVAGARWWIEPGCGLRTWTQSRWPQGVAKGAQVHNSQTAVGVHSSHQARRGLLKEGSSKDGMATGGQTWCLIERRSYREFWPYDTKRQTDLTVEKFNYEKPVDRFDQDRPH